MKFILIHMECGRYFTTASSRNVGPTIAKILNNARDHYCTHKIERIIIRDADEYLYYGSCAFGA